MFLGARKSLNSLDVDKTALPHSDHYLNYAQLASHVLSGALKEAERMCHRNKQNEIRWLHSLKVRDALLGICIDT